MKRNTTLKGIATLIVSLVLISCLSVNAFAAGRYTFPDQICRSDIRKTHRTIFWMNAWKPSAQGLDIPQL